MTKIRKKVVILSHRNDDFHSWGYFSRLFIPEWEKQGIDVTVLQGTGTFVPADAVFLQLNLTVVPIEYRQFMARYPVAINGRAIDISKRRVSTNLVRRAGEYDGPVIVKTNRNYGGRPEHVLERSRTRGGRLYERIEQRLPWTWTGRLRFSEYRIYDHPRLVPAIVWHNRNLVVERFLPERDGSLYCLRQWLFFGDRGINTAMYAPNPIVKAADVVRRERGAPVPQELHEMRARLGFDYGKFDYALVDGKVVLYDTNRTATMPPSRVTPETLKMAAQLAEGIHGFLDAPPRA